MELHGPLGRMCSHRVCMGVWVLVCMGKGAPATMEVAILLLGLFGFRDGAS